MIGIELHITFYDHSMIGRGGELAPHVGGNLIGRRREGGKMRLTDWQTKFLPAPGAWPDAPGVMDIWRCRVVSGDRDRFFVEPIERMMSNAMRFALLRDAAAVGEAKRPGDVYVEMRHVDADIVVYAFTSGKRYTFPIAVPGPDPAYGEFSNQYEARADRAAERMYVEMRKNWTCGAERVVTEPLNRLESERETSVYSFPAATIEAWCATYPHHVSALDETTYP